jgi:serine/threonine-protein kinase
MRDIEAGETLDGYTLTELLAKSGMASIFKAVHQTTGTSVVLKIPLMKFEGDITFYQRFEREEKIGQMLNHPSIPKVLNIATDKSRPYIVMEYAEGTPLRAAMDAKRLSTEAALDVARRLCDALIYLHAKGIVHRDLKPENVILRGDAIKILDFGIALDKSARRLTWFGLSKVMGTPDYMAPEQIRGRRGDARTDVYAVGTMLYEMLTGHLPFEDANMQAFIRAKTNEDPDPPSRHLPKIDPSLETIVLKSIARDPAERYAGAREMLEALANPSRVVPSSPVAPRRGRSLFVSGLFFLVWLSSRRAEARLGAPALGRTDDK